MRLVFNCENPMSSFGYCIFIVLLVQVHYCFGFSNCNVCNDIKGKGEQMVLHDQSSDLVACFKTGKSR